MRSLSSVRQGLTLLVAGAALIVAAWLYMRNARFVLDRMANHLDFESFWLSAKALLSGHNIYTAHENLNPPVLTLMLAPLGLLEFSAAYRLFALITVGLVIANGAASARGSGGTRHDRGHVVVAGAGHTGIGTDLRAVNGRVGGGVDRAPS
jgi:hypothetical protein